MIEKDKRVQHKGYLNWVASLACINCGIKDETIVAHHLKGCYAPLSGGMGRKANDYFTMPLCFKCHDKLHKGDEDLRETQPYRIMQTLDRAFKEKIIRFEI
tara:strand:- start:2324 stop:2626 length:303 start_codon:yes stop_codon:yes gene_type:complete